LKVIVTYMAPVQTAVNTATGKVEWVNVVDESTQLNHGTEHPDGRMIVSQASGQEVADQTTRELALEIAETMPWPAWEIGR
jgi:hypothetical protein